MFCKFCGNELGPEEQVCSSCGQKVVKGATGWKIAVVILCVVVLVAVLAVALLFGTGVLGGNDVTEAPTTTTATTTETTGEAVSFTSYTVDDDTAAAKSGEVVATVGKQVLTNGELQMHYWYQVYNFLQTYSYYISGIGLDLTKGLDEQTCYLDNTMSWQEYFLNQAVESWKSYAVLCEMADAEGFTLDAEQQNYLDNLATSIQEDAVQYGYSSVEDMLLAEAGPGCTTDGFIQYRALLYKSMNYFSVKYEGMTPTEDEVVAYFEENAADLEANGAGKDAGKTVDVRHILITPEGGTQDEQGTTTYSDDEWAACQTKAEQVYQQWKDGEKTEESFAELANANSTDPGSNTNGGLYENVADGDMVEEFNAWIMDTARQIGDTGLVKTQFGYHIMYYVGSHDIWYTTASEKLLSERFEAFINGGMEQYPMEADYDKIVLGYVSLTSE